MATAWTPDDIMALMDDHAFFGGLTADERQAVVDLGRQKTAEEGEILFQTGDRYQGFYLVLEGTIQIYRLNESGRMLVLHVMQAGESFAEVPLFEPSGADAQSSRTYPATAETLTTSRVLFLPARAFLRFVEAHPRAGLHMLGQMAGRLREAVRRLDALSLQGVKERLARHLCRGLPAPEAADAAAPPSGDGSNPIVSLDVPKSVLAAELGTVPETLSRALSDLEDDGLIARKGDRIELTDPTALQRLGQE